jgi:neopullulanase
MTTPDWVQDAVFYQIFPDRFAKSTRNPSGNLPFEDWELPPTIHGFKGGDLYGIAEKLDYLEDLGITALYLNPIFSSASNHRYHTFDYYNVDPLLGGNDAFRELLDKAHEKNIRIILDGVFNHASRGFWQFHHVLENGIASPYRDWFYFDTARLQGRRRWGAYPTSEETKALQSGEDSLHAIGYRGWWNLPALPKFNTNTPAVRKFIFDVAQHWVQFGIDGWRLDVPGEIDDDSFWQEFRYRVRQANPQAYIVGEIWHEAHRWLQGDQFDAVMNYLVTAAALSFCAGRHLNIDVVQQAGGLKDRVHRYMDGTGFANEVDRMLNLYRPETTRAQLNLIDSHDMPRFLSCAGGDKNSLKLAWLFIMTIPGAPCIYYGDEIGMDGRHDPDCRKSFLWDESKWDSDLRAYAKEVIALRRDNPALRHGDHRRLLAMDGLYCYSRTHEDQSLIVGLNASESPHRIEIPHEAQEHPNAILGSVADISVEENRLRFTIPARSGVVLK